MCKMRVCLILVSLFVVLQATLQFPQNDEIDKDLIAAEENGLVTGDELSCKTARNITGVCVVRARCDFGPGAIDFTLYAPRWYKGPCKEDEACCPYKYLVPEKELNSLVDSFEFDDDD